MIKVETENLIIRNHIESDWESLYDYLSLPEIYRFEPGAPITQKKSKVMISERCKSDDFLAVVHKMSKKMIGHLYFHHGKC
ncbi:MAG: hypothetical protein PQJ59_05065 [Spirochaetales bacterium]|nr:hypothetical protein [Spirochaetales bacterium]